MATQAEVAAHLDVSRQIVSKLCAQGILTKAAGRQDYDLDTCRLAYIRNLREQAAGRAGQAGTGKLDLVQERARQAREAADAQALKNAETRKELLPRAVVMEAMQSSNGKVRSKLLGLPSRIAPLVAGLKSTTAVETKLTEVIYEALAELAATPISEPPEDGSEEGWQGDQGSGAPDTGDPDGPEPDNGGRHARVVRRVRTAAKADGKPVGRRKPGAKPRGQRRTG